MRVVLLRGSNEHGEGSSMPFGDRDEAGRRLAGRLAGYRTADAVVLGVPRGGVPVARRVAEALDAPLDVIVVRRLRVPDHPELGLGAVAEADVRIIDDEVVFRTGVGERDLAAAEERARAELAEQAARLRAARSRVDVAGRTATVVDDGAATGTSTHAACRVAREQGASRVVLALPVAPPEALRRLAEVVDEIVCLETPLALPSIGEWYRDFDEVRDADVAALLGATPAPRTG
ncbi:phosphoribosyltransferase [Saccharopolyspora rosea]|uniref:phosphoribosyltransferase n=1 Tax=Saccharopolyspora rosea TaxID=524884 RepID=UPI0021D8B33F|nr:phosphoribosyltransferase family protein [Saccharopolyspora rosea]